jgi:DDE superfamily endonuclease
MPIPIICADAVLCQFAAALTRRFSQPQRQYFVTVLLGLLLCREPRTLAGLHRAVRSGRSYSGLARYVTEAPWNPQVLAAAWTTRFRTALTATVQTERARRRPARRGRPAQALVTGYLIGDDSVCHKPWARQPVRNAEPTRVPRPMAGVGQHYASTAKQPIQGHCMVFTCYSLLGRCCPQAPALYRQQAVCVQEGGAFASKIDLMAAQIRAFVPVPATHTHILLDSWYSCKQLWKLARELGYSITTGLKSNRQLWIADPAEPQGGRWVAFKDYAANLTAADYQAVEWPQQEGTRQVYVHVVRARVRKLYTCQVVLVRTSLTGPVSEVRYWASSDLVGDATTLVGHIATRWTVEVVFADVKELGLDEYQVLSAAGVVRWWSLVLAAYCFLEEARAAPTQQTGERPTIGAMRRHWQQVHERHLVAWLFTQFEQGCTPDQVYAALAA